MGNIDNLVVDPSADGFSNTMMILSHELLHRWAAYVSFIDGGGNPSKALLSADEAHWNGLLDSQGSVQYGNNWQDNGDGTFTALRGGRYYSDLDLYLMGLADASEVAPMLLITNPSEIPDRLPQQGLTISGDATYVSIDQIIAAEGNRIPSYANSPKNFRIGYIFASSSNQISPIQLDSLATIIKNWETWLSSQTLGRAKIFTQWLPLVEVPENPGGSGVSGEYLETADLNAGLTWLTGQQLADGSWMDSAYTIQRDTASAVEALALLLPGSGS